MKKMKNICLLAFAFSFLTSCGSLSNVPIDQNNNNNNNGTSFNFSEYDFETIKNNIMQLYKREEGLTIEASLSEKTISQDDNGLKVDEEIIDLNISGKKDSFWFTYDSKETQNDEVQNTQTYGFATKNISSPDRTIYSYNKAEHSWNTFNEQDYIDFEGEFDKIFALLDVDPIVFNIFNNIDIENVAKSSQGGKDCYHLTYKDGDAENNYNIDLFLDCTLLIPMKVTLRTDSKNSDLYNTKVSEITYFGAAFDEPNW